MKPSPVLSIGQLCPLEVTTEFLSSLLATLPSTSKHSIVICNFSLVCRSWFHAAFSIKSFSVSSSRQAHALTLQLATERASSLPSRSIQTLYLNLQGNNQKFIDLLGIQECDDLQHLSLYLNQLYAFPNIFLCAPADDWWTSRFSSLRSLELNLRGDVTSDEILPLLLIPSLTHLSLSLDTIIWTPLPTSALPTSLKSLTITFGSCSISNLSHHSHLLSSLLASSSSTLQNLNLQGLRFWNSTDLNLLLPSLLQIAPHLRSFSAQLGSPPSPDSKSHFQSSLSKFLQELESVESISLGWDAGHSTGELNALGKLRKLRTISLDAMTHSLLELEALMRLVERSDELSLSKIALRAQVTVDYLKEKAGESGVLVEIEK